MLGGKECYFPCCTGTICFWKLEDNQVVLTVELLCDSVRALVFSVGGPCPVEATPCIAIYVDVHAQLR